MEKEMENGIEKLAEELLKESCTCMFTVIDGKPVIECPDQKQQEIAVKAINLHEIAIRAKAKLQPEAPAAPPVTE